MKTRYSEVTPNGVTVGMLHCYGGEAGPTKPESYWVSLNRGNQTSMGAISIDSFDVTLARLRRQAAKWE